MFVIWFTFYFFKQQATLLLVQGRKVEYRSAFFLYLMFQELRSVLFSCCRFSERYIPTCYSPGPTGPNKRPIQVHSTVHKSGSCDSAAIQVIAKSRIIKKVLEPSWLGSLIFWTLSKASPRHQGVPSSPWESVATGSKLDRQFWWYNCTKVVW